MKFSLLGLAAATSFLHRGKCGTIRGSPKGSSRDRSVMEMEMDTFSPLNCNQDLGTATCSPWTSLFGNAQSMTDRIVIQCGECIVMDFPESPLLLDGGLDIQGKLVFPDDYEIVIRTPMIAVQGELQMLSTKPVDGNPAVRIVMTGGGDNTFRPIANNEGKCGGECSTGKKAIVVAGGRVEIKGLPQATPAWLKLHDVDRRPRPNEDVPHQSKINQYLPPPTGMGCDAAGRYFSADFSNGCERDELAASPGAKNTCTASALKVHGRTSTTHGLQLDLKYFRHCIEAGRDYLLTVAVRLNRSNLSGESTGCLPNGTNCIVVQHAWMDAAFVRGRRVLWAERPSLGTKYGELLTVAVVVIFSEEDLLSSNVYQLIQVNGLNPNVDIEMERLSLFHPQASMFPTPSLLCQSLAPPAGDAEHESFGSPYPFYSTHPWILLTIEADGLNPNNNYFRVRGRNDRAVPDSGLAWDFEGGCLFEGAYLDFTADVRMSGGLQTGDMEFKAVLRAESAAGERSSYQLADCRIIEGVGWQSCDGSFVVPLELASSSVQTLQVRLVGTSQVNFDVDNVSLTIQGGNPDVLIVDKEIINRWAPGAELLITSHTTNFDDHQVRRIAEVNPEYHDERFARIVLDQPLPKPTTELDSTEFAVEVALLSRNIVWESGSDASELEGGHFWVFHTGLKQHIEGLEIKGFGVQGTLARYPIHFHFCGDANGSVVLKTSVRDSNQRAIVVHATDNLLVEENVAFNTLGHAFVLEDGFETGNTFKGNLGAYTRAVNVLIPDNGFNGIETDNLPATFWATNPSNHWIGNVAAGSEHSGFWFELKLRGTAAHLFQSLDPRYESLGSFLNNTAHSNFDRGLRTYPEGYMPYETAHLLGFTSYRNKKQGLFFHNTENILIADGLFADNGVAVDLDRSENITVSRTKIIGRTELYGELESSQEAPSLCYNNELLGMELHTFVRKTKNNGAVLDVAFDGFNSVHCARVAHISLDNELRIGTFDWFTTLERVSFADQPVLIDFCPAAEAGIVDAYLTDLDGSFEANPDNKKPRSIISDSDVMTAFLGEDEECTRIPEGCYAYCDVCFRTIRFEVDPSGSEGYELEVCTKTRSKCIRIAGGTDPTDYATSSTNYRVFNVHLPAVENSESSGFNAAFLLDDEPVWPNYVEQQYEDKLCPGGLDEGTVELHPPPLFDSACDSLIRNGDAEAPDRLFWLSKFTGVSTVANAGMAGSTALKDSIRTSPRDSLVQLLDARCFRSTVMRSYEVEAWVKVVDENNEHQECHVEESNCPEIRIATATQIWPSIATVVPERGENGGYQLLHGVFVVENSMTDSNMVEFIVMRNRVDFNILVDNVSMKLLPDIHSNEDFCSEIVRNGFFADGSARFWSQSNAIMELVGGPSNFSLQVSDGQARASLKAGCFASREYYQVQIQYKIRVDGKSFQCDPLNDPKDLCPTAFLLSYTNGSFVSAQAVAKSLESSEEEEWSWLLGLFVASSDQSNADGLLLQMDGLNPSYKYVINFASIQPLPKSCRSNILVNGNMEMGTAVFWDGVASSVTTVSPGFDDDVAMLVSQRERPGAGPRLNGDFFDTRCLKPAVMLQFEAQIKLVEAGTENPALCDVASIRTAVDACPALRFEVEDAFGNIVFAELLRSYPGVQNWVADGWNEFRAEIHLPPGVQWDGSVSAEGVFFHFRSFPSNLDMLLDNVLVRQIK